ncbi:uncharacterized protein CCR75_002648 [Bremia lactucae]|uniref:RxLR effector protein n=1 Tax=Bremia lactucae TaxID=4779 RepID=A0A976FGA5_BRELC|nr:hypothetical protein CCR75_002648 [Bremia lactucae]
MINITNSQFLLVIALLASVSAVTPISKIKSFAGPEEETSDLTRQLRAPRPVSSKSVPNLLRSLSSVDSKSVSAGDIVEERNPGIRHSMAWAFSEPINTVLRLKGITAEEAEAKLRAGKFYRKFLYGTYPNHFRDYQNNLHPLNRKIGRKPKIVPTNYPQPI